MLIAGGVFSIKTGDDGFHADNKMEITGGEISLPVCYEGIEGLNVTISGGDISIDATDDAVNAAGGVDSASQGPGVDRFAANGDIFVRVSGGALDLYAVHDGIDANGNCYIEGGEIQISAPSMGMEGAIDLDGRLTVNGGELITAGSVLNATEDSTQPLILISYTQEQAAGSVITLKNADGDALLAYTSRNAYTLSGFTSSSLQAGETYSLFIDGEKRTDITLSGTVTGLSEDGGAYNGGRGGGRGNWGGGRPPDGGFPPGGRTPPNGVLPPEGRARFRGDVPGANPPSA
jgi:hypothetical protein